MFNWFKKIDVSTSETLTSSEVSNGLLIEKFDGSSYYLNVGNFIKSKTADRMFSVVGIEHKMDSNYFKFINVYVDNVLDIDIHVDTYGEFKPPPPVITYRNYLTLTELRNDYILVDIEEVKKYIEDYKAKKDKEREEYVKRGEELDRENADNIKRVIEYVNGIKTKYAVGSEWLLCDKLVTILDHENYKDGDRNSHSLNVGWFCNDVLNKHTIEYCNLDQLKPIKPVKRRVK